MPKTGVVDEKYDGIAILSEPLRGQPALWNRDARNVTHRFPEVLAALPRDAVLVLEMCRFHGIQSLFNDLGLNGQRVPGIVNRMGLDNPKEIQLRSTLFPCVAVVHDILEWRGEPFVDDPLEERRKVLQEAVTPGPRVMLPRTWRLEQLEEAQGFVRSNRLEGVVVKDLAAPYRVGRSYAWMRWKDKRRDPFTVLRYHVTKGTRGHDGFVLMVPTPDGREERVVVNDKAWQDKLREALDAKKRVVATVEYLHVTSDGRLRQPTFIDAQIQQPLPLGDYD